jgi:hypothetical protein
VFISIDVTVWSNICSESLSGFISVDKSMREVNRISQIFGQIVTSMEMTHQGNAEGAEIRGAVVPNLPPLPTNAHYATLPLPRYQAAAAEIMK